MCEPGNDLYAFIMKDPEDGEDAVVSGTLADGTPFMLLGGEKKLEQMKKTAQQVADALGCSIELRKCVFTGTIDVIKPGTGAKISSIHGDGG